MSSSTKDIVVVVESADGVPTGLSLELLALARQLAGRTGGAVCAVTLESSDAARAEMLATQGADRIFCAVHTHEQAYEAERWLPLLSEVIGRLPGAHVLLGHTALGAELGPRLALRLDGTVATACERVEIDDAANLVIQRQCFGGKAREVITLCKSPSVATVRARMYEPLAPAPRQAQVVTVALTSESQIRTRVIDRAVEAQTKGPRLETAKIVVGGGRGVGGPEGFRVLERLAEAVGAAVGASRVACDLGWCPPSRQIGLSGRTISPDLYIAVGISGASQHMAGCGKARAILAINSDPEAAIFKDATFGIVGDYQQIVPALIEQLTRASG